MKVKATQLGYYGVRRRRIGDVFNLRDKAHFSKKWMAPIGWVPEGYKAPKAIPRSKKAPVTNVDVSEVFEDDDIEDDDVDQVEEEVPLKRGKSASDMEVI